MEHPSPGRVIASLATPFSEAESLDFDRLAELAVWVCETGRADAVILTDDTGESHALADDERMEAWTEVMDAVGKRVPVIAGIGVNTTRGTIRLGRAAGLLGVSMVLVSSPSSIDADQTTVYRYHDDVARGVDLPVMVHNTVAGEMDVETLRRLMDRENVVAVKDDCRTDPMQNLKYLLHTRSRGDFAVYSGSEAMALPALAPGSSGHSDSGGAACRRADEADDRRPGGQAAR